MQPVLSAAIRSNTGDGLRMAQAAGASLWHMWHYHGSYGFRHPDPDYPFGVRLKRLPDWTPGHALRNDVTMSWILVDRSGNRFMNEYEPYMQDTGHRALEPMDFVAQRPARLPAVLIVDAAGRDLYPLSAPTWNDEAVAARFADVSPRMMDEAIQALKLADLRIIDRRERAAADGATERARGPIRPSRDRPVADRDVAFPPAGRSVQTQGGPAHDERTRARRNGRPDPRPVRKPARSAVRVSATLMSAELFSGGRIAGREAAAAILVERKQHEQASATILWRDSPI
jgi:hypothetical protein